MKSPASGDSKGAPVAPLLKINGVPIIEALANRSRVSQIVTFLNQSGDGEVYDTAAIAAELGTSKECISVLVHKSNHRLEGYMARVGLYTYYARPANLQAFLAAVTNTLEGGKG